MKNSRSGGAALDWKSGQPWGVLLDARCLCSGLFFRGQGFDLRNARFDLGVNTRFGLIRQLGVELPNTIELRFIQLFEIQKRVMRALSSAYQFVQLQLHRRGIAVLRALNEEDH